MAKRISLFIANLTIGGAERVAVNLANQLSEMGYQVEVIVVTDGGELADDLVPTVEQSTLPVDRMRRAAVPLAQHIRRTRPTALISFMTGANVMAILATKVAVVSTTVIATEHSTQSHKRGMTTKPEIILAKHIYSFANYVVGVSEGVSEDIRKWARVSDDKVVTIYNPTIHMNQIGTIYQPPSHPWFQSDDIEVVLSVGRHAEEKDYQTLIRSFSLLLEERKNARLMLLGGGKLTSEYESLIAELNIESHVALPGFVRQPYPYMAHADVFALSSRVEGLSLVLIEAMACGTPVVSTDCPSGPSEILAGGEYGELVPVGDPTLLKNALIRTLSKRVDEELLKNRASDFSTQKAATRYEALFVDDR